MRDKQQRRFPGAGLADEVEVTAAVVLAQGDGRVQRVARCGGAKRCVVFGHGSASGPEAKDRSGLKRRGAYGVHAKPGTDADRYPRSCVLIVAPLMRSSCKANGDKEIADRPMAAPDRRCKSWTRTVTVDARRYATRQPLCRGRARPTSRLPCHGERLTTSVPTNMVCGVRAGTNIARLASRAAARRLETHTRRQRRRKPYLSGRMSRQSGT